jgi:glucose-1-phosphate adenylyltransferase
MPGVLAIVLAGGEGKRLMPLTLDRAKPAVPFAGQYRLVDFALSNLANAGFLNIVGDERPDYICVFGADHIYRMDPRQMLDQHLAKGAGVTVAGIRVDKGDASQFGVIEVGEGTRIHRFLEKPTSAQPLLDDPNCVLASMGNYIFTTEALVDALAADSRDASSRHDMGGDVIPSLVTGGCADVYDFSHNQVPGATERDRGYWRDVGTLDSYYDASMDLVSVHPVFNLYNHQWPIYTSLPSQLSPAKFVFEEQGRVGQALDSVVSGGVIVSGGTVRRSVLSPGVLVESGALVEDSVLMNDVRVGPGAVVRRAILDKNVTVDAGAVLEPDAERIRGRFTMSDGGVIVVGKGGEVHPT